MSEEGMKKPGKTADKDKSIKKPEIKSPLMRQYFEIKNDHPDEIVFYRLGDFYEMFYDDALTASRELELTLTGKNVGTPERAPMCGVPYHSCQAYIARLIARGYKVVICEQMEDPAKAKGLVKRDVVRIVTPGTVTDESMLDERKNNFICAVYMDGENAGLAFCDVSTGEAHVTSLSGDDLENRIITECARYEPREALLSEMVYESEALKTELGKKMGCCLEEGDQWRFEEEKCRKDCAERFNEDASSLDGVALRALGALVGYLHETQKNDLKHLNRLDIYKTEEFMILDQAAQRNLELYQSIRTGDRRGTLIWALDRTSTPMGARLLRRWMEKPLLQPAAIQKRLLGVAALHDNPVALGEAETAFRGVSDMERLSGRIACGAANARDLRSLSATAEKLPALKALAESLPGEAMSSVARNIDVLSDLRADIEETISEEPSLSLTEGGIIKKGKSAELDKLRAAARDGRGFIAAAQNRERERTGIKNLKIGYNKVFGYYIEITKSFLDMVPSDYIRRQTLTNCERYITEELKNMESTILGAQEHANALEYEMFLKLRDRCAGEISRMQRTASALSEFDALASFARAAADNNYVMPLVDASDALDITDGRHPVVEQAISGFVANDTKLDCRDRRLAIITGPNMAGKSTYMRQSAIIALMAQMGSFVPAKSAHIGVADRIFTRIGASDDLAGGQSTFMVEMSEVAGIIREATAKSIILLDEIGRGTSTYDGMAIARAVLEFAAKNIGARTLFATHYHELTALSDQMPGVINLSTAVRKRGEDITFLHRVVPGGADDSYGIEVARLAGVGNEVIRRAKQILKSLEAGEQPRAVSKPKKETGQTSMADMGAIELVHRIREMNLDSMSPVNAMNALYELQIEAKRLP